MEWFFYLKILAVDVLLSVEHVGPVEFIVRWFLEAVRVY